MESEALIKRTRLVAPHARVRAHVVDAALNGDKSMLVVVLRVPGAPQDESSAPYFRFQAVSVATWQAELPHIDVADWSKGLAAPVWCIRCAAPCLMLKCILPPGGADSPHTPQPSALPANLLVQLSTPCGAR